MNCIGIHSAHIMRAMYLSTTAHRQWQVPTWDSPQTHLYRSSASAELMTSLSRRLLLDGPSLRVITSTACYGAVLSPALCVVLRCSVITSAPSLPIVGGSTERRLPRRRPRAPGGGTGPRSGGGHRPCSAKRIRASHAACDRQAASPNRRHHRCLPHRG